MAELFYVALLLGSCGGVVPVIDVGANELRALLAARGEQLREYQADVELIESPGTDRAEVARLRLEYADWLDRHKIVPSTEELRKGIAGYLNWKSSRVRGCRYSADAQGRIRIDPRIDPDNEAALQANLRSAVVYNGEDWKSYREWNDPATGRRESSLSILHDSPQNDGWFEIARGAAVDLPYRFAGPPLDFPVSRRALDLKVLGWEELLSLVPEELSTSDVTVPPGGGEPKPVLILETAPFRETGRGVYRLRVWFAPEHCYAPCAVAAENLDPSGPDEEWVHILQWSGEWSDPIDLENEITCYGRCRVKFYERIDIPAEGLPIEKWVRKPFHHAQYDFTLSNLRVGSPVDPALFDVQPVSGTNVLDQSKGYFYVVGSGGHE